jgi:hypothetical protein
MRHQVNESLHEDRLIGALCAVFAALALLLTSVGIYGVSFFIRLARSSCKTPQRPVKTKHLAGPKGGFAIGCSLVSID